MHTTCDTAAVDACIAGGHPVAYMHETRVRVLVLRSTHFAGQISGLVLEMGHLVGDEGARSYPLAFGVVRDTFVVPWGDQHDKVMVHWR